MHQLLSRLVAALLIFSSAFFVSHLVQGKAWIGPLAALLCTLVLVTSLLEYLPLPRPLPLLGAAASYSAGVWVLLSRPGTSDVVSRAEEVLRSGTAQVQMEVAPVVLTPEINFLYVASMGLLGLIAVLLAPRRPALIAFLLLPVIMLPTMILERGSSTVPLGSVFFLYLLLLALDSEASRSRWSGRGAGVSQLLERNKARAAVLTGIPVLLLALLVPLPVRSSPDFSSWFKGGDPVSYSPLAELQGTLNLPLPRDLLYYDTTSHDPEYLRSTTLGVFDENQKWSGSTLKGDLVVGRELIKGPGDIRTTLEFANLKAPWLPLPLNTNRVELDWWRFDEASGTVFSDGNSTRELSQVRVTSSAAAPTESLSDQKSAVLPPEIEEYAKEPSISKQAADLAQQVTGGTSSRYEAALLLQNFFLDPAQGFVYDHETVPPENGAAPLDAFLENRQGFCVQYASAYAALARSAGLPARVALGFTPGEKLRDGRWRVTTNEAHAWPEVWFERAGWVRFEPTPRYGVVTPPPHTEDPSPAVPQPPLATPSPTVPSTGPSAPSAPPEPPGPVESPASPTAPPADTGSGMPELFLVGITLVSTLAFLVVTVSSLLRRRWRHAVPEPLTRQWMDALRLAEAGGCVFSASSTPRAQANEILQRLESSLNLPKGWESSLARVVQSVEHSRYAPSGTPPVHDGGDLWRVETALRRHASRTLRGRARVFQVHWFPSASGRREQPFTLSA